MAAARYWRIHGLQAASGTDIEVAGVQLWAGGSRVDAGATVTANTTPTTGTVANLKGTSGAVVRFAQGTGVLVWLWDFGSATTVNEIRVRAGDNTAFPVSAAIEYSTDGVQWVLGNLFYGASAPGPGAWLSVPFAYDPAVVFQTSWLNAAQRNESSIYGLVENAGASQGLVAGQGRFGGACFVTAGGGGFLRYPYGPQFNVGANDFDIAGFYYVSPSTSGGLITRKPFSASNREWYLSITSGTRYLTFSWSTDGSTIAGSISDTVAFPNTAGWVHCGVTRRGGTLTLYRDGTAVATGSIGATAIYAGTGATILANVDSDAVGGAMAGRYDQWQIKIGATGTLPAFSVPTAALPTIAQSFSAQSMPPLPTVVFDGGAPSATSGSYGPAAISPWDVEDFGSGTIVGTVKRKGTPLNLPLARRVRLVHQRSGRVIRETWSDAATGNYTFANVKTGDPYCVMAFDHEGNFRGVIADNIMAVVQ